MAKKTKTHSDFFVENKEAVFFKNNKDCIKKCKFLLNNEKIRKIISRNGKLKMFNNRKTLFEYKIKYLLEQIIVAV